MFVVTREGYKLPVDASAVPKEEYMRFQQNVALYDDYTILKDIWILELNRSNRFEDSRKDQYELTFVKELRYDHEPTREEILWAMSAWGCSRFDVVFVKKAYELDMEHD